MARTPPLSVDKELPIVERLTQRSFRTGLHVNPDGHEAATLIIELVEALDEANCALQQFRGIKPGNGWDDEMRALDEAQAAIRAALARAGQ